MILSNSNPEEFTFIWQSKLVGKIVIEIERTWIPFLSDVFVDFAVVVNLVPRAFPHPFFKGKALGTRLRRGITPYWEANLHYKMPKLSVMELVKKISAIPKIGIELI